MMRNSTKRLTLTFLYLSAISSFNDEHLTVWTVYKREFKWKSERLDAMRINLKTFAAIRFGMFERQRV